MADAEQPFLIRQSVEVGRPLDRNYTYMVECL